MISDEKWRRINVLLLKTFDLLYLHCLTHSAVSDSQTSLLERLVTLKIEPLKKFTHARSLRAQALAWSNLVLKQRNILKCIKGDGHSKTTE